jgi:benzoylformate decarboxylase
MSNEGDGRPSASPVPGQDAATVRDMVFQVLKRCGMTTISADPESTGSSFLAGLPHNLGCRLALHEGTAVDMATGYASATGRPAFVNLRSTAGLANAIGALATARANRVPLVVVVTQQDRRNVSCDPITTSFISGWLAEFAGQHPVWAGYRLRAQDVPATIVRARHEAMTNAGPAIVVVPSDDWLAPAGAERSSPAIEIRRGRATLGTELGDLAAVIDGSHRPAIVVGSAAVQEATWTAVAALAEWIGAPVWQEPSCPGADFFPRDHPAFAGDLPPDRSGVRAALDGNDVVLSLGAPVFRRYLWEPGDPMFAGTVVQVMPYAAHWRRIRGIHRGHRRRVPHPHTPGWRSQPCKSCPGRSAD